MATYKFLPLWMMMCCVGIPCVLLNSIPRGGNDSVTISISNRQNETGQTYAQVKLEEVFSKRTSWKIDISHETADEGIVSQPPEQKTDASPKPLYQLFPGLGYYKLHTYAQSWYQAKLICKSEGAHLAVINSQKEIEILQELRRRLPRLRGDWLDDIILIGMSDEETEGVWKTIFNETLEEAGFAVWEEGQPGTTEDCGCIDAKAGKLHDCGCLDVLPFFCERAI